MRSDFATREKPVGIAIADFDGDGRLDIATAHEVANTVEVLSQLTSVLSRTYIKFGNVKVGDTKKAKVIFSNIGSHSFEIHGISLGGTSKEAYSESNNCGPKLPPGKSCEITILFTPPAPFHTERRGSRSTTAWPTRRSI